MEEKKYPIGGYAPGNYYRKCCSCGYEFKGDKRAVQCEPCGIADKEKFDAMSPAEKDELMKRNAAVARYMFTGPFSPERDLIYRIVEQWGNAIEMPNMEQWLKDYASNQHPAVGNVWVKATTRLPGWDNIVEWRFAGKEPTAKETVRFLSSAANLHQWEWLDESNEQPVEQKEDDAVVDMSGLRETIEDIILSTGRHSQEQCTEIADAILREYGQSRIQKKQTMTTEQLLKPRYIIIADYPGNILNVGSILVAAECWQDFTIKLWCEANDEFPHLFQPLPWYSDRKLEDMPEYVKCDERVWKVTEWKRDMVGRFYPMNEVDTEGETENFANIKWHIASDKFLPATREEYEQYLKQIK